MKKFSDKKNGTRAAYADAGLAAYLEAKGDEDSDDLSNVVDLITDLLHLAHRDKLAPAFSGTDGILHVAGMNYDAEA